MRDKKEQSVERSKKSAVRLTDFLAEESAGLVPGGTSVYKLSKLLLNHASAFYKDRREKRLEEFHRKILGEGDQNYWEEIKEKEFSFDEYYSLLNYVVQDEEDNKIAFYAKVFRLILLEKIEPKYRMHIVRSVRELKASDFELMKKIYISEKYEQKGPGYRRLQVAALTNPDSPLKLYSIQTLIRFGYLSEREGAGPPWPTKLLKTLVEKLFDESELRV